jgi:hypothetical protein
MAKMTKNALQIITQKTKDRATRTPLKTGGRLFVFLLSKYFNVAICHSICYIIKLVTLNAFFSFDLFMVSIPECKQQLRTINDALRYEILHALSLSCSFNTLSEQCNYQRPRCDIEWLHVTNPVYNGSPR